MLRSLIACLALSLSLAACKVPDPLYCDENTPCKDPARPFCDLNGDYPASEGIGRTCIPDPSAEGDAGPGDSGPDGSSERRVVQIATTEIATCAVLSDGALRCWGLRRFLGEGTNVVGDDELPYTAGDIPTGGPVAQVGLSYNFGCVRYQAGNVRCWGRNDAGQLGYGHTNDLFETPDKLPDVQLGGPAVQLVVRGSFACALLQSHDVRCWGRNAGGQLGLGNTDNIGDDELPDSVGPVDIGGVVTQLASGEGPVCAVLEGGTVRCWGNNTYGDLGYGNLENVGDDETPAQVGDINVGGKVLSVAAAQWNVCALLEGGSVRCWGSYSGLGIPGSMEDIGDNEAPASSGNTELGGAAISIASTTYSTCAVLQGGALRCWGSGQYGQLGHASTAKVGDDETPAQAGDVPVGGPVASISAGTGLSSHRCAILESGSVRCWGEGVDGVLGYGNTENVGDDETPASAGDVQIIDP